MIFGLDYAGSADRTTAHFAPLTESPSTFGERTSAAMDAQQLRLDSWALRGSHEADLTRSIMSAVGPDPDAPGLRRNFPMMENREQLLARAQSQMARIPDAFVNIPTTLADFNAEIDRQLQGEYADAQAVLSNAPDGSWGAEVLGNLAAGATDEATLMTLPFGLQGSIAKVALSEAVLGVVGEALTLPRQFRMADTLGIDSPNVINQLAVAGATGAVMGVGLHLGGRALSFGGKLAMTQWDRFATYRNTRNTADAAQIPPGTTPIEHEQLVAASEAALTDGPNGRALPDSAFPLAMHPDDSQLGPPVRADGQPPAMADFDYSPTGNASPTTNRAGYVFGRLLGLGYDEQTAMALVGNMMVESGPGMNPRAVGDGGNAYGIVQWNGPRRRDYLAFAQSRGKPADDLDTQIAFLDRELRTTERPAWDAIRNARSIEEAASLTSARFFRPGLPHINQRIANSREMFRQYQAGHVPRWTGPIGAVTEGVPTGPTTRGFTRDGQVTAGDDSRIDVTYEVVDASLLRQASGDLQPRDRAGRVSSAEQVAEIAARLDPARLMPSPEADRGAPVVGPDNVIESGNGRVQAINRAADLHPDRYGAYRSQIEALGYTIPPDVQRPVLIARRTSDLTPAARQQFIRQANTSAVARMSATERAGADAAALSEDTVRLFDATAPIAGPRNKPFVMRALAALPQAERNALVDASGALNAEGITRLRAALFARAYDAPDILARFAETGAGELRSLLDALEQAAPAMAALRADIAAGAVRAEMDISPFILDAMRLIGLAREAAARGEGSVDQLVADMLADIDLLDGIVAPLTQALVAKFYANGRAVPAADIAAFLTRYADKARKVGTTEAGLFGDAPGPIQVLQAIDPKGFAGLTEVGTARPAQATRAAPVQLADDVLAGFDDGAISPAAVEADAVMTAQLRAVSPEYFHDFSRPNGQTETELFSGDGITIKFVEGEIDPKMGGIVETHDITINGRAEIIRTEVRREGTAIQFENIYVFGGADLDKSFGKNAFGTIGPAVIRTVLRAYKAIAPDLVLAKGVRVGGARFGGKFENDFAKGQMVDLNISGLKPARSDLITAAPPAAAAVDDSWMPAANIVAEVDTATAALRDASASLRPQIAGLEMALPDGTTVKVSDVLDDLDADDDLLAAIDICMTGGRG